MALFLFTKAILEGKPIEVYNHGKMRRDFTYIDDIVEGVIRTLDHPATAESSLVRRQAGSRDQFSAGYRIYNIGNHQPVELLHFIEVLGAGDWERRPRRSCMPLQPGDVPATYADIEDLTAMSALPRTPIEEGIARFVRMVSGVLQVTLRPASSPTPCGERY